MTVNNRFFNSKKDFKNTARLQELRMELDKVVVSAYKWEDLTLGPDFHETAQGTRFTVSESARREVLSRLLKLNHERWEEEQRMNDEGGMMNASREKKSKGRKKSKSTDGQMGLL